MKKFIAASLIMAASSLSWNANAQCGLGIANHLGVDANVGTTGIGFELSTPITPFVQARAGISFMPGFSFNVDTEVSGTYTQGGQTLDYYDTIESKGNLKRVQGSVIFNIYPFGNHSSFFVAAGGYFGGKEALKITGHSAEAAKYGGGEIEIGDYKIPLDKDGNVSGGIKVNSFRPYFGIGTGRPCPKGRLNFMWELGVQVHGTPKLYTNHGEIIDLHGVDNDDTFQKIMDNVKVYPVLKFTISGRIL